MTISPNAGLIGAPHDGHFISCTPAAAIEGADAGLGAGGGGAAVPPRTGVPHFMQNAASSGFCAPHLMQ